jgi:hypothetical protein
MATPPGLFNGTIDGECDGPAQATTRIPGLMVAEIVTERM